MITDLMEKYELNNESECILGQVLHNRRVNGKKSWDLSQAISNKYSSIFQTFRKLFRGEKEDVLIGEDGFHIDDFVDEGIINCVIKIEDSLENLKKASAWYYACYSLDTETKSQFKLFSFCWVVADLLFLIREQKR